MEKNKYFLFSFLYFLIPFMNIRDIAQGGASAKRGRVKKSTLITARFEPRGGKMRASRDT